MHALGSVFPEDGIVVLESPSSTMALRNQLRLSRPGSYYFGAGGGLGFGLSAAVGVQLAQPDRPVICVVGEGSVQYAVTAFWTAAAYDVPVTFCVLRNSEYAILKWFAEIEGVDGRAGARPARARHRLDRGRLRRRLESRLDRRRAARGARRRDRLRQAAAGRGRRGAGDVAVLTTPWAGRSRVMALLEPRRRAAAPRALAGERRRGARLGRRRDTGAAARRAHRAARRRPGARPGPPTWSATPPTPAPTGCSRRRW